MAFGVNHHMLLKLQPDKLSNSLRITVSLLEVEVEVYSYCEMETCTPDCILIADININESR